MTHYFSLFKIFFFLISFYCNLQIFLGGSICSDGGVKVTEDKELKVTL